MRVLQIFAKMDNGGAEAFIMNIYRKIDRSKIQFDFVVHYGDEGRFDKEIKELGGNIFVAPNPKTDGFLKYKKWWNQFLKDNASDYKFIHAHFMLYGRVFGKLAKKYNLKTVFHSHSAMQYKGLDGILRKLLYFGIDKKCDYQFACSTESGICRFGNKVVDRDTFYVIPNGVEVGNFRYNKEKRDTLRKEFNIAPNKIVVGHVGRLVKAKNHAFIIDVFNELSKTSNDYLLVLVGSGALKAEIEEKVNYLGLTDKVLMLGDRNDVSNLINVFDVVLFPSISEGLPLSVIEAQSNGVPIFLAENITDECVLTDLVKKVSLSRDAKWWADLIIKSNLKRDNLAYIKVKEAGFDTNDVVSWISNFYLGEKN